MQLTSDDLTIADLKKFATIDDSIKSLGLS